MKKTAKSGNKQKQKETNAEIERLEREQALRHEREIAELKSQRGLDIVDIPPDGDCLYNAVANQLSRIKGFEQVCHLRRAAKYIREHKDDFIPFLESDDPLDEFEFEKYCHGVENESKDGGVWGGEPELNALSQSLERSIEVCNFAGFQYLIFGEQFNKTKPLIIVYHRHAYQLGAHYNSTAIRATS
ncbi:unnamed protein product [Haemonchus placei]|uniref:OTU domain-containing protein n=1 Tax=Haemonchus placei TaxID=6290 RepID=A0A0N4W264_HAEPC|nr:unnamed protein product [Haemonchus placei]